MYFICHRGLLNGVWSGWSHVWYATFSLLQVLVCTVHLSHSSSGDDEEPQENRRPSLALWGHLSLALLSSQSYLCLPSTLPFPVDRRENTPSHFPTRPSLIPISSEQLLSPMGLHLLQKPSFFFDLWFILRTRAWVTSSLSLKRVHLCSNKPEEQQGGSLLKLL